MTLQLHMPTDLPPGIHCARTDDGHQMSLLLQDFCAVSQPSQGCADPSSRQLDLWLPCTGQGWVLTQLRGSAISTGGHGWAELLAWVNGRPLRARAMPPDEPLLVSTKALAHGGLRLSLLLLAQRDLEDPASTAGCWVDSIDLTTMVSPGSQRPDALTRTAAV